MSSSAATPGFGGPALDAPAAREAVSPVSRLWWLWLVVGIGWILAALIALLFDEASITTAGIIVGVMLLAAGASSSCRRCWRIRCGGCGPCSA